MFTPAVALLCAAPLEKIEAFLAEQDVRPAFITGTKLQNPVAALISVPFQSNFDFGLGSSHTGWRYTLNMQPVIPISLTKDWNLISRTILPVD
jgi:hypothetical protein